MHFQYHRDSLCSMEPKILFFHKIQTFHLLSADKTVIHLQSKVQYRLRISCNTKLVNIKHPECPRLLRNQILRQLPNCMEQFTHANKTVRCFKSPEILHTAMKGHRRECNCQYMIYYKERMSTVNDVLLLQYVPTASKAINIFVKQSEIKGKRISVNKDHRQSRLTVRRKN